ncbi:winged helix-turn-helix domain-containing protein [Rhodocyclus tenuis]|uniref:Putative ArsR family transcriptional regulator n=1 Tax=Rhodocyclus tenuis TaxID=1066 RepID=A0A840G7A4_RHOTE|nr:winged helix-turn-helix domain-containing protein [Rhodocyclus tenuis]MBB4247756.1 putative ArsR family transcriptional regulator [Rhodocyclus tenuis]
MQGPADFPLFPEAVSSDRHHRQALAAADSASNCRTTATASPLRKQVPTVEQSPAMQRLLRLLQRKADLSVSDMAAEAFVGINTLACGGYVSALKKAGYIHVSGWRKTRRGFSTPLYSRGDQPDLPRPEYDDAERAAPGMDLVVSALQRRGPMSYTEIAGSTGLSLHTIKNSGYLTALRTQKRVHICGWRRARKGPMTPIYDAGVGSDVAKPETFSSAEKSRRYRERKDLLQGDRSLAAQTSRLLSRNSAARVSAQPAPDR